MNVFYIIAIVLVGIIALILLVAALAKKDYSIERQIIISQPKKKVFDYIKMLKNQDSFSKWANIDPAMKKEYRGIDGTVGFVSAWESKDKSVGKGEQTIKAIIDGEKIDFDLHFIEPFDARANASMCVEKVSDNQTKVYWNFNSKMKFPTNLMLLFTSMEKTLGDDLATGLWNLKTDLERQV